MPVCKATVSVYTDVVAGSGSIGYYGDGGFGYNCIRNWTTCLFFYNNLGVDTPLVNPWGCVGDDHGSLFVSDQYHTGDIISLLVNVQNMLVVVYKLIIFW
jgi:hypothetical protein